VKTKVKTNFMKTFMILVLLPAAMIGLQGCAVTSWTTDNYGKADERFSSPAGPAYGNTTRIYVQGEKEVDPNLLFQWTRRLPAYIIVDVKDGEIISKEVMNGYLPPVAFEHPEILTWDKIYLEVVGHPPPLAFREIEFDYFSTWNRIFLESGRDMAFTPNAIYIQNPDNPHNPYKIWVTSYDKGSRSTSSKIAFPFVYAGAMATDIVLLPVTIPLVALFIIAYSL